MTVLCDGEIKEYQEKMKLIEPFDESLLGPASYGLRVGRDPSDKNLVRRLIARGVIE